jgi:hypothetical protein
MQGGRNSDIDGCERGRQDQPEAPPARGTVLLRGRWLMPRPAGYRLPEPLAAALAQVFGEDVRHVRIIEYSRYARLHGARATTRPGVIYVTTSGDEFARDHDLVLHEYFHVLKQWQPGRLTRLRYLAELARKGYRANRYEREARAFAAAAMPQLAALLARTDMRLA